MKRLLMCLMLSGCAAGEIPCSVDIPLQHGCDRTDHVAAQLPPPPPPCDDCNPPPDDEDDPEPPGCASGSDCAAGFERDPVAYEHWKERHPK